MISQEWETQITEIIQRFPDPHRQKILHIWEDWLESNPIEPFYENWRHFSSLRDEPGALFTDTRIYLKRITNELREREIPSSTWQKVAKALAAVASVFLVIFLALSRAMRVSE
ncbi:MAG: hypothetical protein ACTSV2_20000 [Candidatus Thorarchaeota archaeon]